MAHVSSAPRDLEPGFLSPFAFLSSILACFVLAPTILTLIAS